MNAIGGARARWRETHGVTFELVRYFLAHIFDSEMFSVRGQWRPVAIGFLALALPASIALLDPPYAGKGLDTITAATILRAGDIADQFAVLTLMFSITALAAVLAWQSLFPGRRDYLLFAGLPVRSRQIFLARFFSMLLFAAALVVALNILPALMPPHRFTASWDSGGFVSRFGPACLGCGAMFFAIVALQGILLQVVPGRWFTRVSTFVQAAVVCISFTAGLASWFIVEQGPAAASLSPFVLFATPSFWFAGLHRTMLGDADPLMIALARRALVLAIGAPACAALAYLLAYNRSRTLMIEAETAAPASHAKFLRWFARTPREEAIFQFLALTLTRSRTHRLAILAWSGAAIGILLHAVLLLGRTFGGPVNLPRILQFVVLYWPLGLSTILLFGVRHAYSMPAELTANWLFQTTEQEGRGDWMRAVERFTWLVVLLPVYVVIAPLGIGVMGWAIGLRMTALQLMVSFATFDILFYSWQKLPFTCSYTPGRRPPVIVLAGWIAVLGALVPVLSIIIAAASQIPEIFAIYGAFLLAITLWLRYRRRAGWGEASLLYEDPLDDLADLGIRELRPISLPSHHAPSC